MGSNSGCNRRRSESGGEGLHLPVMAEEVVFWLKPERGGRFFDGTVGLGGHAEQLLRRGASGLVGMDKDTTALFLCRQRLSAFEDIFFPVHGSFAEFERALDRVQWEAVDGVLLDLGVSSLQLDDPNRGFSFLEEGPLDMRMDPDRGRSAEELVNTESMETLRMIIAQHGEEPMASRIARAIVRRREEKAITTTTELAEIVSRAYPAARRAAARNHPATKTFQALRIAVNEELEDLRVFLSHIHRRMHLGARIAVISFHSLEDRIVKRMFREMAATCICPEQAPRCVCSRTPLWKILTKKPQTPTAEEVRRNPRSRSAKLRAAEKVAHVRA